MSKRYTYSRDELESYFVRICMPKARRVYDVSSLSEGEKLTFLNILQKHQLVKVPWENLTQHYSWHATVNVKPKHLFRKIVNDPPRGGYCMEVNYFYHLILVSLNFDVYMAGSRVYFPELGRYGGWTHVVNVVTIAGTRYLVDGGFGPQGPTAPLALKSGIACTQISPAQMRVVYDNIPNNLDRSQRVWIYQHRHNEQTQWTPMHCFTDLEFTPEDVEKMNYAPWLSRHTFFTHKVVASRFTTEKETNDCDGPGTPDEDAITGEIDGAVTLNHDVLKWRRHGENIVVVPFKTDDERVAAISQYFGITLADEDREAILDTMAMIGVKAMGAAD